MVKSANSISKNDIVLVAEIYERLNYQFVDLMNFSFEMAGSYRKSDAVAAIISDEITRIEGVTNNAVWIVIGPDRIEKMALNGKMIHENLRETADLNPDDQIKSLIERQRVS